MRQRAVFRRHLIKGCGDARHRKQRDERGTASISEPAIATLVSRFYGKARRDPTIGPLFEHAIEDWDEHLDKLRDFWSSVMLTSGRYKGNPMAAHLEPVGYVRFFVEFYAAPKPDQP
ncbi:MAG TPA: group III truncated hemoglobin [Stellaceae bacterium]|nr:group III truncated hemoglobin [Stellaceae bacterium]